MRLVPCRHFTVTIIVIVEAVEFPLHALSQSLWLTALYSGYEIVIEVWIEAKTPSAQIEIRAEVSEFLLAGGVVEAWRF